MADSSVVGTRRDGKITITDGAASSYEVSFEVGILALQNHLQTVLSSVTEVQ